MQMEVGIEDCLHIEFEYDKSRYHLSDTVVGKIYFLLVRIKLKHMEVRSCIACAHHTRTEQAQMSLSSL